jgi:release factor glutamine methyltransferase
MDSIDKIVPAHEQKILESHVRGIRLSQLPLVEKPMDEYQERRFKELLRLRMKGIPLQYLTGTQDFFGREFYVNSSVLIPRPETEGLVELVLSRLPEQKPHTRLNGLEFGAGSGCISITLCLERADVWMQASECEEDALKIAEENAIKWRVGNLDFFAVSQPPHLWQYEDVPVLDFIVSNPPYLGSADEIDAEVKEHEPNSALFAPENDILFFYRFLKELMENKLKQHGFMALEINHNQGGAIAKLFADDGCSVEMKKDLTGRERYAIVRR